jgi:hypothetical protein
MLKLYTEEWYANYETIDSKVVEGRGSGLITFIFRYLLCGSGENRKNPVMLPGR